MTNASESMVRQLYGDTALKFLITLVYPLLLMGKYFDMICRAHQLVMEGFKWHFNETVLTVWSAPNYCYRCGNVAAILELNEHLQRDFTIFEAAPQESRGIPSKKPQADYFL